MSKFLLQKPIITEKATTLSSQGQYVFLVDGKATKPEVNKAVTEAYKVKVASVRIINIKPKRRRLGRTIGFKSGYKKAIVTLMEGEKLDILPQA